MKRIIAVIIAALLLSGSALAEVDLSSMTDEELIRLRNSISAELAERSARANPEGVIFENDDFLLYSTGTGSDRSDGYHLNVVFMNKTSVKLGIMFDYVIINGWQFTVYDLVYDIEPGAKAKLSVTLDYANAELNSVTDITDITFSFHTFTESYESTKYDSVLFVPVWQ